MFSRYIKGLSAAAIAIATLALAGCTAEPNPPADTVSTTSTAAAETTASAPETVTTAKPEETTAAKTEESTAKSEEITTAKTEESTAETEEVTTAKTEKAEETEAAETTKKEEETLETNNKPILCGVEYRYKSSMTYGSDISIHITDKEIVYASYFPWEGINNYDGDLNEEIIIEHQPIEQKQWADIEKAVNAVLPVLGEGEVINAAEKTALGFSGGFPSLNGFSGGLQPLSGFVGDFQPLDGVDSNVFRLTWREDGKETTYSYPKPGDRRFLTLIDVLCETVHPVGREIIWYGEPVINGVYVTTGNSHSGKDSDFSFQCTKKAEGEWWFFANYGENEQPVSYTTTVNEQIWNRVSEKLTELNVTQWEEGKYGNDLKLTLYYSDEKQVHFTPDKNNLNELRSFFLGIIEELKNE